MSVVRLSIVTPTLNSAAYFGECLESIHAERSPDVEIQHIVVDGGSRDGTVEMASRFRCQIIQDEDEGLYDAMNIGIRHADGDAVGIVNSDDTLLPGAPEAVAEWYRSRRSDWTVGGMRWVDADGVVRSTLQPPPTWMSVEMFASLGWNCAHHGATYLTREFYDRIGGYDLSYPISADYDLLARALSDQPFHRIRRPLATFRRHDGSTSLNAGAAATEEGRRIAERFGPRSAARRRAYRASLRLWLNGSNPRWYIAKRRGMI